MILRRWTSDLLETYLKWAVDPITHFFETILKPATDTFAEYAIQSTATPGMTEWMIALLFLGVYVGVSVALVYVCLDVLSVVATPIYTALSGKELTDRRRLLVAIGVYVLLAIADAITRGHVHAVGMTKRIAGDLAVAFSMFTGELPNAGVDITGFTWGVLANPVVEFVLVVTVLIASSSVVVWRFTDWPEQYVTGGLVVGVVAAYIYTSITGIDVFPITQPWGFFLQVLILWFVMMTTLAWVVSQVVWGLLEWFPVVRYEPDQPRTLYMTFDGLVLLAMFPIFTTPITALLMWVSYKLFRHGGGKKAAMILVGKEQECEVNPETGRKECSWTRGD